VKEGKNGVWGWTIASPEINPFSLSLNYKICYNKIMKLLTKILLTILILSSVFFILMSVFEFDPLEGIKGFVIGGIIFGACFAIGSILAKIWE
jgi:hypothetical protein